MYDARYRLERDCGGFGVMAVSENVLLAMLSLIGTMLGTFGGILTANKLSNYRIEQLEKKVDKHNGFGEKIPVIQEQIKVINHRIDDLEHKEGII